MAEIIGRAPEGGMTAAEYAQAAGLHLAGVYAHLDRAERAGLIRRHGRPARFTVRTDKPLDAR